jgi:hypothetical protein
MNIEVTLEPVREFKASVIALATSILEFAARQRTVSEARVSKTVRNLSESVVFCADMSSLIELRRDCGTNLVARDWCCM